MKIRIAVIFAATLALAACGRSDNAATEAEADTVEIPANEALQTVDEAPVADPNANASVVAPAAPAGTATPVLTEEDRIQAAGDSAADTAAAAADAAAETQTEAEGQ